MRVNAPLVRTKARVSPCDRAWCCQCSAWRLIGGEYELRVRVCALWEAGGRNGAEGVRQSRLRMQSSEPTPQNLLACVTPVPALQVRPLPLKRACDFYRADAARRYVAISFALSRSARVRASLRIRRQDRSLMLKQR